SSVDLAGAPAGSAAPTDADDSWFSGAGLREAPAVSFDFGDGSQLGWDRGAAATSWGVERDLRFFLQGATGAVLTVDPYMGMAAHLVVASFDGSVFAHLHPSGSISMAAMQRFAGGSGVDPHAGHAMPLDSRVTIPYAFPKAGAYRLFVQIKRDGRVL